MLGVLWTGFSWAVYFVTWVFLAQRESKVRVLPAAVAVAFTKLTVACVVIGFGYGLEPALWQGLQHGPERGLSELGRLLSEHWYGLLTSGFLPGSFSLMVAATAPTPRAAIQRAMLTVVLCLMAADVFWGVVNNRPIEGMVFSLFSDVFGGIIAGLFVGWLAGFKRAVRRLPTPVHDAAPAS